MMDYVFTIYRETILSKQFSLTSWTFQRYIKIKKLAIIKLSYFSSAIVEGNFDSKIYVSNHQVTLKQKK